MKHIGLLEGDCRICFEPRIVDDRGLDRTFGVCSPTCYLAGGGLRACGPGDVELLYDTLVALPDVAAVAVGSDRAKHGGREEAERRVDNAHDADVEVFELWFSKAGRCKICRMS
jgi:hypothetical protein